MVTVGLVLIAAAFVCVIVAALEKAPLWVAVLLLCVVELLRVLPVGK